MKNTKQLLSMALIICLIFTIFTMPTHAATFKVPSEVAQVLEYEGSTTSSIVSTSMLMSHSKGSSFTLFVLKGTGYLIYDSYKSLVVEYSMKDLNPYKSVKTIAEQYYYGPVQYFAVTDDSVYDIAEGKIITNKDLSVSEFLDYGDDLIERQRKSVDTNENSVASTKGTTSLNGTLRTWASSYYCGLDGCAIMLMYFDDYYSDSYVHNSYEYNSTFQSYLINNLYIPDTGTTSYDLVSGKYWSGVQYTGLDDYLSDRGLSTDAKRGSYSLSTVISKISSNKPVMLNTSSSHPNYPGHWIIAHAVVTIAGGPTYITINNGFGSNNISVSSDSSYYQTLVYIE